jgi:hypothetical protein
VKVNLKTSNSLVKMLQEQAGTTFAGVRNQYVTSFRCEYLKNLLADHLTMRQALKELGCELNSPLGRVRLRLGEPSPMANLFKEPFTKPRSKKGKK